MSVSHSASADHLATSLRIFRSDDLTQVLDAAHQNIDNWIQTLRISGETAHATIAADLVQLKGYLSGSDPDPISSTLQTLAEHINSIVDNANPRFIDSLDQLSKALSAAARDLQHAKQQQQQ
jgi:hypothetical protein